MQRRGIFRMVLKTDLNYDIPIDIQDEDVN